MQVPASEAAWASLETTVRALTGEVRVIVVRLVPADEPTAVPEASALQRVCEHLARPDLVSVGAVPGPVGSAGFAVALACDLRVLSTTAQVAVTGAGIFGSLGRLAQLVGYPRALELSLTGRRVSAREAESIGLANLVVSGDQIDDAVDDLVAALLSTPRAVATEMKAALRAACAPSALDVVTQRRSIAGELDAAKRLARDDG